MSDGYVYVLTNEFMPELVKIGFTLRTPEERAAELYDKRSGVPGEFRVAYKHRCRHPQWLEGKVHRKLSSHRVNGRREFFRISLDEAIEAIQAFDATADDKPASALKKLSAGLKRIQEQAERPLSEDALRKVQERFDKQKAEARSEARFSAVVWTFKLMVPTTIAITLLVPVTWGIGGCILLLVLALALIFMVVKQVSYTLRISDAETQYMRAVSKGRSPDKPEERVSPKAGT